MGRLRSLYADIPSPRSQWKLRNPDIICTLSALRGDDPCLLVCDPFGRSAGLGRCHHSLSTPPLSVPVTDAVSRCPIDYSRVRAERPEFNRDFSGGCPLATRGRVPVVARFPSRTPRDVVATPRSATSHRRAACGVLGLKRCSRSPAGCSVGLIRLRACPSDYATTGVGDHR